MRTCTKCLKKKKELEYYSYASGALFGPCRECTKLAVRANYKKRREQYREYERERWKRPERKQQALEAQRRRRARYPEKDKARSAVGNALRDGRLTREPCEVCGSTPAQAHHDDYSKPLEVKWLCLKHHRKLHKAWVG